METRNPFFYTILVRYLFTYRCIRNSQQKRQKKIKVKKNRKQEEKRKEKNKTKSKTKRKKRKKKTEQRKVPSLTAFAVILRSLQYSIASAKFSLVNSLIGI